MTDVQADAETEVSSVVVPATWHDLISARNDWLDAPYDDVQLQTLLEVAKGQVLEFAPALLDPEVIPTAYRLAQLMQARNLWNASKVDAASGALGDDSYVIRPYPMDWIVKGLLRPKSPARPGMF